MNHIKIARRNNNSPRHTDDIAVMAETEEELKRLLMRVKEESENTGLKVNILKTKIMAFGLITSCQKSAKDGEALYSQQKQDQELTGAQIMSFLLQNSDLN